MLRELFAPLVRDVAIDLNGGGDTETDLYFTPTGYKAVPVFIILHSFSAAVTASVITIGKKGGVCNEFLGDQTLNKISATGRYLILQPVPTAQPTELYEFAAGETIALEITANEGGVLTCKADVYGRLIKV